ncbi:protocadherin-23 [Eublepharis macularius]|uniref:Protocadherin-23 n=1 Tax=Eublepharis macularius TaxID=481883 RepID=A0AA97JUG5_EUBMA|nr:protocadherin-23 [Eublepharis macularius]
MGPRAIALGARQRSRGQGGRLISLWLCFLCTAGGCSGQVYNLSLAVDEGLPADTLVGDISAGLPPGGAHPGGFFLSEGSGESAVLADFHVQTDTGIIRTARPLDRELRARYSFVAATLQGEMVQVEIAVADVNDHAPHFPRDSVRLAVSELSPPGSVFRLPAARDPDAGSFGTQGYSLVPEEPGATAGGEPEGGPLFQLRYGTPPDTLDLALLRRLDRERADTHRLRVEAWDGGSPRRSGRLRVEIQVLDENDNAPAFEQSEYRARVREDAPAGSSVCRLVATDPDLGANGEVRYSLSRRQGDPSAASYFEVDARTGLLRLLRPLDREARALHRLAVEARDGGAQPEAATALVAVEVLDVNDNSPAIHLLYLTEAGASVSEGARPGDYVARVSVSDPDGAGETGGGVALSLQGGDGAFSLRPSGDDGGGVFFLCVEGPLDRESRDAYELRLVAVDAGSPPLSSQRALLLRVADLNDQAPAFAQPRYRAAVSEAASPGTVVLLLSASDADAPGSPNAQVRYSLGPRQAQAALFHLDPRSGVLSVRGGLDHEREARLELLVLARDLGEPPLSTSCLVSVDVEDANDHEPVFQQQVYNASLAEHSRAGLCLLQVKATDRDSGHFGHIEYFLYDGFHSYEKSKAFQIDPSSGHICVSQDIDREEDPATYDLLVRATDGGGLSAQAFLRIEIEDINDNHPVFNPASYVTSISSHMQPGTEVINVVAVDKDSGIYGVVTYELEPGDFSSLFTVDTSTGIVYLTSSLSKLEHNSVLLTVSARDGGGLCSVVNAVVSVKILETAVAPAIFDRSRYTFSVPEDIPEGSAIGTVKAREPLNFLETISYRISSGDPYGRFSIDSQYGIIRTKKQLDHETHCYTVLTVQSQLGNSPVYSNAQVNITVIDVNDNPPVFVMESDKINISRSTVSGTALYIAHAEDKDSGLNGAIRYTIANNQSGVFNIDPVLGVLYLARTLVADKQKEHTVHIVAEDHGSPPLSSLMILTVVVVEQKECPNLSFENLVYHVDVRETCSVGAIILQVQARNLGPQHTHGTFIYSLEHNTDSAPFRISPETGSIYLRNPVDYELTQTHTFRAYVTNPVDTSGQNASTSIIVNILDENDNSPVFMRDSYFFEIEESSLPQGVVGILAAVDKDSGRNGQLSYFLLSEGKYFRINSNTGEIINWVALDHEQHAHHQLVVLVTDHGVPQHNATVTAYISVTDLNDNHPCFPQFSSGAEFNIKVLEGQPSGTLVATVHANDLDSGKNGMVSYSLSGESLGHFQIDSGSGELRTAEALLYNWRSIYRMVVTAADQGSPSLQGQMVINVEVIPLPKGSSASFQSIRHFVIPEHFRPARVLGSLRLPGQHLYTNKKQRFSILVEDSHVPFEIDSSCGDLFLFKELDYETASHYFFRVVVNADGNFLPQNNTLFISIDVEDQNDHSPSFQNDVVVIGVEENVPVGTLVYTFNARDGDGSFLNSNIQYSIARSNFTENLFLIHPFYGSLITAVPLDREVMQFVILTVVATDQAVNLTDRRQGSLTAKIIILDVNDNHPTFVSSPVSYIREDAEVGSSVHSIVAHDPDQGRNGEITYYLLSSSEDHVFALDKSSGLLTTTFMLDRENQECYSLTIMALDDGTPALSATQILTIIVLDVNDEPPVFSKALYQASTYENKDPGEVVIKIEATDKDSGTNSMLRYEILPGPGHEVFQINSDTGEITTTISLDREAQDIFTFKVLVRDSGSPFLSSRTSVIFRVLDENDHAPTFLLPVSEIQILENQQPSIVSTILAVDMDAADNGAVQCQIIDGNVRGYFALNESSGDLSTTCVLDREIVSNFTLVIGCSDQGDLQRSSMIHVQITVIDENDNSPLFARDHYQTSVREDLGEGEAILELHAVDGDEGPNGEVRYSLIDDTLGAFTINQITGTVTATKLLDREKKSQYVFRAVATDMGLLGPRSSSVTIIVYVEDVNDNSPLFLQNPVKASVPFQTSVNQTIATMKASDLDLGLNGAVNFMFETPDTMFQVDPNTGEIFLQEPLPHEGVITYLVILASDQGVPARTATAVLAISSETLTETISFSHSQYEATVPENSAKGTSVFTPAVYDHGLVGKNLKYTLISEHEDIFSIHPITGAITVEQPEFLDYEVRKKVRFTILADNGLSSALCGMTVLIQDMNDNAPHFEQSCFTAFVWEGQLRNTYIMQVYATDADSGLNGEIEYSILSGNTNEAFIIDSAKGIISANRVLNREDISSYRLVLQATDGGTPRLSAMSTIEIQVVDVNDNAPTLRPRGTVELPENAPLGFLVTQVLADDVDLGPPLHYNFAEGGNPGMKFAIDRYKGIITLVQVVDFEEIDQLELLISVSDSVHQTTGMVSILISDVNDNPPVFTQDVYQVIIPELTTVNASVLTVCATDRDLEDNGKISYRILSSPDGFSIDPKNGSLFLAKSLTYQDKNPIIELLVEAVDHGIPPLTAVTSVIVQIQDVNNYAPQFTMAAYNLSVRENAFIGEKLLTFSATDYDTTHDNSYVEYSIIGGNGSNKFHVEMRVIGPESPYKVVGNLVLRSVLDREKSSSYQLLILASDRGSPLLNSTATVSITVLDINDNPPIFTSSEYYVHVRENTPVGSHITAVSASDYDAGSNAEITYSIVSGNDEGHFRLDGKTGSLDLVRSLDYEETMAFSLTVQAFDGGVGIKNVALAAVFVSVLDDNDYAPMFVSPNLDCRAQENLPPFSFVCAISALDFDTGPCGHLSYSVQSPCLSGHGTSLDGDMFFIDPLTGVIHTKQVLDFEHQIKYCFVAQAKDKSDATATVTVRVTVEGTDEFNPVFNQDQYFFDFPEVNEAGQLVGRVSASDYDRGLDGVVRYSLLKQSPFFTVNQSSGAIYLTKPFHRKSSNMKRREDILELLIKAHSPKLGSKSTTCTILVNISSIPQSSSMLSPHTLTISIAAFTVLFLFLVISLAMLIVRYRPRDTVNSSKKKEMPCCSPTNLNVNVNSAPKAAQETPVSATSTLPVSSVAEWLSLVGIRERKDVGNPCRHSDSSGHGSAEGETAEDEEIQRINECPCRKGSGSTLSDQGSRIPDSGIPRDSDQLSCQSGETDVVAVIQSTETIQVFGDGAGGEERDDDVRYTCNNMLSLQNMEIKEMDVMTDIAREYNFIPDGQNSHYGSLATLVDSDEDRRGCYNWDYLLNWEPRFKPLASVFSDIAELKDESIKTYNFPKEIKSFIFPPPLITSVAQPGLKTVPPRMPTLLSGQAFKKYPHSPLFHNLRYPPSAMTPSFSPSLSLLTMQTPVASPVAANPSLKGVCPGGPTCELSTEEEIQV